MTWVRIDDAYADHPKMAEVGPLGQVLWLAGLAYCNRNLTDGFIPWAAANRLITWTFLDGTTETTIYVGTPEAVSEAGAVSTEYVITLVLAAGLWDEVRGGYQVHDYADYQPTKAQVLADRAQKQAAGRAGGVATATARGKAHAEPPAQAESKPVPIPVPNGPNPVPRAGARDPNQERFDRDYERTMAEVRARQVPPPSKEEAERNVGALKAAVAERGFKP